MQKTLEVFPNGKEKRQETEKQKDERNDVQLWLRKAS